MYLDDTKKFDKLLIKPWTNEIKPYILKNYPLSNNKVFNINSDIYVLTDLIEKYKNDVSNLIGNQTENDKNVNLNNKNNNKIIVYKTDDNEQKKKKGKKEGDDDFKKELKNKIKKVKSKAYEEEDIKLLRKNNLTKISKFLEDFIQQNTIKRKKTNSMINLRPHSQTIASATTCDDSTIIEDMNIHHLIDSNSKNNNVENNINSLINKLNKSLNDNINDKTKKSKEDKKSENLTIIKENANFEKINDINNVNNNKNLNKNNDSLFDNKGEIIEERKKIKPYLRSKTIALLREMIPKYSDVEEENNLNIKYTKNTQLEFILPDLLLKKIIFEDFLNNNKLLIYHLCQQCFCFINKEIFFKKIIDCYHFYKKKNTDFILIKNILEFFNILVIEICDYCETINFKEEYAKIIKNFYSELINDFLNHCKGNENSIKANKKANDNNNIIIEEINSYLFEDKDLYVSHENKKLSSNINDSSNNNINKKNLIRLNLNTEDKNIKIFMVKEKKDTNTIIVNNNEDKENKLLCKSLKEDKNLSINNNNQKINNKSNDINDRNYKRNIVSNDIKNSNKEESILNDENKKEENKRAFQIYRTLRTCELKNINEEENSSEEEDDSDSSSYSSSQDKNSKKASEKKKENKDKILKSQKKEEKENIIKNMVEIIFEKDKIVSEKEKIFLEIRFVLNLLDKKKYKESNISSEIKVLKEKLSFYKAVDILRSTKYKKALSLPLSLGQKRLTKTYSVYNIKFTSHLQINTRDYLSKGYFCITDWKTEEIGDKLSQITQTLLSKIHPKELYCGIFNKKNKEKTSPNVTNCSKFFNKLTMFIIEDVISYNSPKERAKVYEKWVQVAEYLKMKKNYNDYIAIISSLNNYIITGLESTQKEIKSKTRNKFEQLKNFCIGGNYSNIKEEIIQSEKMGEHFLPYLGILLKFISQYEEKKKYIDEHGCIDIRKIETINEQIDIYFSFKKKPKTYAKIKELNFFDDLEVITEEELEKIADESNKKDNNKKDSSKGIKKLTNIDKKYFQIYIQKNEKRKNSIPIENNIMPVNK